MLNTLLHNATRKLKYYRRDMGFLAGGKDVFTKARGAAILVYHGICKSNHTKFNARFITAAIFEKHLAFYKKNFNVVTLDEYYNRQLSADKFNICLTFDDGLANNYTLALPLLEKYNMPATFFITAIRQAGYDILWNDFLSVSSRLGPSEIFFKERFVKNKAHKYISQASGKDIAVLQREKGFTEKAGMMQTLYPLAPFKTDASLQGFWLQMTEEQIQKMAASPLVTIGSHGYYHNDLATLPLADLQTELTASKQYLEGITGRQIPALAFPYGSYNTTVLTAAKQAGYTQLLAGEFSNAGDKANPLLRERFTLNPFISVNNQMYATITGRYE